MNDLRLGLSVLLIGSFPRTVKFGISPLLPPNVMQPNRIPNNKWSTGKPFVIDLLLQYSCLVQMTPGQIMCTSQSLLNSSCIVRLEW